MRGIICTVVAALLLQGCAISHFAGNPEDLKKLSWREVVDIVAANYFNNASSDFMIGYIVINESGNALCCNRSYATKDSAMLDNDLMNAELWLLSTKTIRHILSVESQYCVLYFYEGKVGYVSYTSFDEF